MVLHDLKLAWRAMSSHKLYAVINILGLSVGIAGSLLIYRILSFERSYNADFKNADRIFRIYTEESNSEGKSATCGIPVPAMEVIRTTVPQWESAASIHEFLPQIATGKAGSSEPVKLFETKHPELSMFVEPDFFKIFQLTWLAGNAETALNEINSGVLTQSWAHKLFGGWQNALGKTITLDDQLPIIVRGVVADMPANCDFPLNLMVSYSTLQAHPDLYFYNKDDWGSTSSNDQMFALMRDKNQLASAETALQQVGQTEYKKGFQKPDDQKRHHLQPLSDLHFNEELSHSGTHSISRSRLWILGSIGALLLLMACFNFINLATAMAVLRGKEVGVRKTLGGTRQRLIGQFMSETALIVFIAAMLGVGLSKMAAPLLPYISDLPANIPFLSDPKVRIFLPLLLVAVTILSGLYPAFILAGFNPVIALKSRFSTGNSGSSSLRRALVVSQFVIAQAMIFGAIVAISQLDFIRKSDLGFKHDMVYNVTYNNDKISYKTLSVFKEKLLAIPNVESVSFSSDQPSSGNTWNSNFAYGAGASDAPFPISMKFCDADFQKTYDIPLLAGRWFQPSDTIQEVLVNETTMRKLGISDPATMIGQMLRLGARTHCPIVGVVKDFHTHSLHEKLEPILLASRAKYYGEAGIKLSGHQTAETTAAIAAVFAELYPQQVYSGRFLDAYLEQFYKAENRFATLCKAFAALAIFISCLGLFGLASHAAARRTKEIGIRKVLGASVGGILVLLSRDFLALVAIALVVACPIAWYLMHQWLMDFAFRIDMQWWMFAGTGVCALVIAFITVGYHSLQVATANPVHSLKSD